MLNHLIQGGVAVRPKKSIRIGRSVKQRSSYVVQVLGETMNEQTPFVK